MNFKSRGFTLVQLLVSMSILLVLAAAVFLWIDPLARIGQAKDVNRTKDVGIIATALNTYAKEHNGMMPVLGKITTDKRVLCASGTSGPYNDTGVTCAGDTSWCLPIDDADFYKYLVELPYDPDKSSTADTGYYISKDSNNNLIVGACDPYGSEDISKNVGYKDICINDGDAGAYAGGHCWYVAASTNITCDAVCAARGLECVENVIYGPDVDSNGYPLATLSEEFNATCIPDNEFAATGTPPWGGQSISVDPCTVQLGSTLCGMAAGSGKYGVCPCE